MTAEEWTEAYENAWKTFYSKDNMIRVLSRWKDHPRNYWNLMSIFFWYKNAALIEKQHPMVAGFFRLKERKSRRPGHAIDALPVHAWKRAGEISRLLITWGKFLKEMEEVWLQTRKRSETEERCLAQLQWLQTDIAQVLRIADLQRIYGNARDSLSERARRLLEPVDELSSKIISSPADLRRALRKWRKLHGRVQELRAQEPEHARGWLDEMHEILSHVRIGNRLPEWQESYSRLRKSLPSKVELQWLHFDSINNRIVDSRQELHRVWSQTLTGIRHMKLSQIRPIKFTKAVINDFLLTTRFAFTIKEFSKH
jgi:hypothetical protein